MKAPYLPNRRELLVQRQNVTSHTANLQQQHFGKTSSLAVTEPLSVSSVFETRSFYRAGRGKVCGRDPVPIVQQAEWAPGLVQTCAKISPPSGFAPQTVHPVGNRYTDYAIPAHTSNMTVRTVNYLRNRKHTKPQ